MARPNNGMFEEWLKEENLKKITEWSKLGLFDKQIAKNMGISIATYYIYKKKYPEIQEAIEEGKEVVDIEVENALLKKCLGYNIPVIKCFKVKHIKYNENGKKIEENEEIIEHKEEVHVPADTVAQIFWLKNRQSKKWREKVEVEANTEELNKVKELLSKIEDGVNNE